MEQIGMFCLGAFIGSVIFYALTSTTKWENPVGIISGAVSAAVAGAVLIFIKKLDPASSALSLYPIGLAYGSLCVNLYWLKAEDLNKGGAFSIARLHVIAFGAVSLALAVYAAHLLMTS